MSYLLMTVLLPAAQAVDARPPDRGVRDHAAPPPHAAVFEFLLPAPPDPSPGVNRLAAAVAVPRVRGRALAGLMRLDLTTLRAAKHVLPAPTLRAVLNDPAADPTGAGACGLLLGLCGTAADAALLRDQLDRCDDGRGGVEGVVLGLLLLRGERGLDDAVELTFAPGVSSCLTAATLRALDVAHRDPGFKIPRPALRAAVETLLDGPTADLAADTLRDWRAWGSTRAVLAGVLRRADPDADRGRSADVAAARFALSCLRAEDGGPAARLCRDWLSERAGFDRDLITRAERTLR